MVGCPIVGLLFLRSYNKLYFPRYFRCDMYMHMIDNETRTIVSTNDVLRIMDDKYDSLKKYYPVFAIENFLVRTFYYSILITILNLLHFFVAYP